MKNKYEPDVNLDQFFLENEEILKKIVEFAEVDKNDVVLEIGAGYGNLTKELSKKAKKVIAFEIDKRFEVPLGQLPKNVEIHIDDGLEYIQLRGKFKKTRKFNKIVSNPPYSIVEPLLHNLTFLEYEKVILMIPKKLAYKIEKNPVFGSFFKIEIKLEVKKTEFNPVPKTNSVVLDLIKLPEPIKSKNLSLFLRQYIYQHERQKVRNSLREGLIVFARLVFEQKLTKKEAQLLIKNSGISMNLLEGEPDNLEIYELLDRKFKDNALDQFLAS